ncbi:MAG: ankyrin repeat domain-containing protein [Nitrosomonadales bacterium]|nr:ankyrin repeat domain-containing protein [Nitrosomonadales bacterium]
MKIFTVLKTIFILTLIGILAGVGWLYLDRYLAKKDLETLGITYSESSFVNTACTGNKAAILLFLRSGMDVNVKAERDLTVLHCAARLNDLDFLTLLLEKGADVNAKTSGNNGLLTPLHFASMVEGTYPLMHLIKAGANLNANSPEGTPLFTAAKIGNADAVTMLLNNGSDVQITDKWGNTALHAALMHPKPDDIADMLIENEININAKGKNGMTALHLAARNNNITLVKKLINSDADIDDISEEGTALALSLRHKDIVELLIKNKADPNIADKYGITPLIIASKNSDKTVISQLIHVGAEVNAESKNGETALQNAASHGYFSAAEILLNNGANVNLDCCGKTTALHKAVIGSNANLGMISLLLDAGANVNARDNAGRSPLIEARYAALPIVEFLVAKGANVNDKDDRGYSVLWWYKSSKSPALEFLIGKGAGVIASSAATHSPSIRSDPRMMTAEEADRSRQQLMDEARFRREELMSRKKMYPQ